MDRFLTGLVLGVVLTLVVTRIADFITTLLPWTRAFMSGAKVSVISIVGMRLRGCPPAFLVDAYCALRHAGHVITIKQVESCYIAHKHEISENNIAAFIDKVKTFAEQHPDESQSSE